MIEYSCGFLFWNDEVALIEKKRPKWQAGKLNGIGGHIESGETPAQAQAREFAEETGVQIDDWECFCVLTNEFLGYRVHFFRHDAGDYDQRPAVSTMTDEEVYWEEIDTLGWNQDIVPNLKWLIALAQDKDLKVPIHIEDIGNR